MASYQITRAVEPGRRVVRAGHGLLDRPPRAARRGADAPLGPRPPCPRPRERRRRRSERHVLGRFEGAAPDRRQQLRAVTARVSRRHRREALDAEDAVAVDPVVVRQARPGRAPRRRHGHGAAGPERRAAVRPLRPDDSRPLLYGPHLAPPMPFPIRRDQRAADRRVAPPTIPAAPEAGQRGALLREDAEPEDAQQGLRRPRGASQLIERA